MPKRSVLSDRDKLEAAIATSKSLKEVLNTLGLRAAGSNYLTLKKICAQFGLELPKYEPTVDSAVRARRIPDELVFVENSTYTNRLSLKKRLYARGVPEECNKCHVGTTWQGEFLSLTLEHINGVWNDNRLENLEILCPNCHSQTSTFAGKNGHARPNSVRIVPVEHIVVRGKRVSKNRYPNQCQMCDTPVTKAATLCNRCRSGKRYGTVYPDIDELLTRISASNKSRVAKELGISDTALNKHLKKFEAI